MAVGVSVIANDAYRLRDAAHVPVSRNECSGSGPGSFLAVWRARRRREDFQARGIEILRWRKTTGPVWRTIAIVPWRRVTERRTIGPNIGVQAGLSRVLTEMLPVSNRAGVSQGVTPTRPARSAAEPVRICSEEVVSRVRIEPTTRRVRVAPKARNSAVFEGFCIPGLQNAATRRRATQPGRNRGRRQ
jgi:hypothetical protein